MQEVLKSVVDYNGYMSVSDVEPGGKTGTTNDQYDIWFDGFTPSYAASIWIGTDENVEMSSMSTPAAALWGKIINQIPNAKNGKYSSMPSNVVQKGNEYFTKGTENGLSSWSKKAEEKKARDRAYKAWLKEREKHKKKVPAVYEEVDDLSKPIYDTKETQVPIYGDKPVIGYEQKAVTTADPETGEETTIYVDDESKPIYGEAEIIGYETKTEKVIVGYKKKKVLVKKETYEYEKGWRDGDFKYKGN
jgi:membrane peptidoglycan carboxypeptidase